MFCAFNRRKIIFICFLLSIIVINCSSVSGNGDNIFVRAEIYYYDWDVLTRYALLPEDIRKRHKIKIIIVDKDEVAKFVKWLRLDEMQAISKPEMEDARLVIDLFNAKGVRESYYASQFNLISENSLRKRSVDETFKNMFCLKQRFKESKEMVKGKDNKQ
jgi:hypothetical protein